MFEVKIQIFQEIFTGGNFSLTAPAPPVSINSHSQFFRLEFWHGLDESMDLEGDSNEPHLVCCGHAAG